MKYKIYLAYSSVILCPFLLVIFAVKEEALWMPILTAVIFYLSIIFLWIRIYRGIFKPMKKLQDSINTMSKGNLEESIIEYGSGETKDLFRDFDEMREYFKILMNEHKEFEKETRTVIQNISHDLKTPLTAIKGYAEGIMDGVPSTPQKMEKYIKTIYTKACDMAGLIDELSYYVKVYQDDLPYQFTAINLHNFFSDCISELTLDLEVKDIDLVYFNYTDTNLLVRADAEQLKKVVNNIIGNSVKYTGHKRGIINVRIYDSGKNVKVQIEDNGEGIRSEELPYIFDRFYRTDASRNSLTGGSGLGLSIVKKIIEAHGCRVWAEGEYGVGISIFFTLLKYT